MDGEDLMPYGKGLVGQAAEYNKAIVAFVGMGVTVATALGLSDAADVGGNVEAIAAGVLGLLTVFGVFKVRNAEGLPPIDKSPPGSPPPPISPVPRRP